MKLKVPFLTFIICCFSLIAFGQKKYNGTLFTKLGQEIKGEIKLNLDGSNDELIEVITVEKTKEKGTKQTLTTSSKIIYKKCKRSINLRDYYLWHISIR